MSVHPGAGFAQPHRIEIGEVFFRSGRGSESVVGSNSEEIDWAAVRYPRGPTKPLAFLYPAAIPRVDRPRRPLFTVL